jgi:hypothetical protein
VAYLLDSNVFIQAKNLHYGFDFCPAFWEWLAIENASHNVYSIDSVRDELIGGNDQLAEWAKVRGAEFFLQLDSAMLPSLTTLSTWAGGGQYKQSAVSEFLQAADYYLVAHAHAHGFDVVTHEVPDPLRKKIKIPEACIALGVKSLGPFQMLRREGARFVLGGSASAATPSDRLF